MAATLSTNKGPIQLHYNAGQVVVTPEDQDRFVVASRLAVTACQSAAIADRAINELKKHFFGKLHEWCRANHKSVLACYAPFPSDNCLKVFVVAKSATFDFRLSDSIADLETEFYSDGWPCDILQISSGEDSDLQVFFDPEQSIKVF
jgi:hypothetical protein